MSDTAVPGLRQRYASHTYGIVLALIAVSFLFAATAPDADWSASVLVLLQSATLVAALWASGLIRVNSSVSFVLVAAAVVFAVAQIVFGGSGLLGTVAILSGVLVLAIVFVIAEGVIRRSEIDRQAITGAICIYLLLGMVFMFVYGAMATLGSGPFFANGSDGTRSLRLYFSYVTLATLGYGDYTASGNLGHTLSVVEALFGQLYLVTVVALLVARVRPRRRSGEDGSEP